MKSIARFAMLAALIWLGGCAARPVRAQFIGYVSPQGTQSKVFNAASCNGDTPSSPVTNVGQVVHAVTYTVGSNTGTIPVDVFIEGSNDGTNYFQISDSGIAAPGTGANTGIVVGYGYYPFIRVHVTNGSTGCVITASYNGSSTTAPNPGTGLVDSATYRKILFTTSSAGSSLLGSTSFQTPYGSTQGQIVFEYSGAAGPSGSTLYVQCEGGIIAGVFPIATGNLVPQIFNVPAMGCVNASVTYNSGGASAATFSVSYYFLKPGATGGPTCDQVAIINAAATATIFSNPGILGNVRAHICSIDFSSGTAETVQLKQGTGTNCGTNTTNLTGAVHLAVNTPFVRVYPNAGLTSGVLVSSTSEQICISVSAQTDGTMTYSIY